MINGQVCGVSGGFPGYFVLQKYVAKVVICSVSRTETLNDGVSLVWLLIS